MNEIIDFFSPSVQKVAAEYGCSVYRINNDTGEGVVAQYQVFPGIELFYNDLRMENGYNENKRPQPDVMEINHCRAGRFECEMQNGDCLYLGSGDLAINMLTNTTSSTRFPLSHYHGISITVHLPAAAEALQKISSALGGMSIDIYRVRNELCRNSTCFVMRKRDSIHHIFSELYTAPTEAMSSYFKIKVLELLVFLNSAEPLEYHRKRRYFYKNQVRTVKAVRGYMVEHLSRHFTLEELSEKFDISMTSLKTCFKGVYGTSVYAYMKSYRIQAAALLLRQSQFSITEIALKMGYENPSKFSEAFKKEMGVLPSDYRNSV